MKFRLYYKMAGSVKRLAQLVVVFSRSVDGRDGVAIGGLALLGCGTWMIFPPLALITVGTVLLVIWAATSPLFRKQGDH